MPVNPGLQALPNTGPAENESAAPADRFTNALNSVITSTTGILDAAGRTAATVADVKKGAQQIRDSFRENDDEARQRDQQNAFGQRGGVSAISNLDDRDLLLIAGGFGMLLLVGVVIASK